MIFYNYGKNISSDCVIYYETLCLIIQYLYELCNNSNARGSFKKKYNLPGYFLEVVFVCINIFLHMIEPFIYAYFMVR